MGRYFELSLPPGTETVAPAIDALEIALNAAIEKFGEHPVILTIIAKFNDLLSAYASETHSAPRTIRERRFWARTYQKGIHTIWTGMGRDRPDGIPICDWLSSEGKMMRTTAARVAYLLETRRDIPEGRYLKKLCEEPRCIAPRCHEISVSYSAGRRPSAYYYDAEGRPRCRLGHPVKEPLPGKSIYCPACYQIGREAVRAAAAAKKNADARTRGIQRMTITPQDSPEDKALLERTGKFMDWAMQAHPEVNLFELSNEQADMLDREYKQFLTTSGRDPEPSQPPTPTHDALWDEIQAMFDTSQG